MALRTQQIALNATTATPLLVQGTSAGQFPNITGSVTDPLPVIIQNQDAVITITVGGPNVKTEGGIQILAGQNYPMSLIDDVPYAVSASGTPNATIQVGRQ